jgi:hypothetical protein
MALRNQDVCDCCGCFTRRRRGCDGQQGEKLCAQCVYAGCDKKKKGERCYLAQGAAAPKPHTLPPARTDAIGPDDTGGRGKISFEGRTLR